MHVSGLIHHYGYAGVFFILFMEMIGIPFPAETTLVLSGITWMQGDFAFLPLIIVCVVGHILGSSIAYGIGRYLGRPTILKYGKFIRLTESKLDEAEQKFLKYRIFIIFICKFIAGIRILIPYMAGLNKMSFSMFSLYNSIATVAWVTTFLFVGHSLGLAWHHYHRVINHYLWPILVLLAVVGVFYSIRKFKKKKTQEKEVEERRKISE